MNFLTASELDRKIMQTLFNPLYPHQRRTVGGIATDVGAEPEDVVAVLERNSQHITCMNSETTDVSERRFQINPNRTNHWVQNGFAQSAMILSSLLSPGSQNLPLLVTYVQTVPESLTVDPITNIALFQLSSDHKRVLHPLLDTKFRRGVRSMDAIVTSSGLDRERVETLVGELISINLLRRTRAGSVAFVRNIPLMNLIMALILDASVGNNELMLSVGVSNQPSTAYGYHSNVDEVEVDEAENEMYDEDVCPDCSCYHCVCDTEEDECEDDDDF